MFKRISNFINKHNILHRKQFEFQSKHSTLHAILGITDRIQRAVEDGCYSCGIFLDLSKAFDTDFVHLNWIRLATKPSWLDSLIGRAAV